MGFRRPFSVQVRAHVRAEVGRAPVTGLDTDADRPDGDRRAVRCRSVRYDIHTVDDAEKTTGFGVYVDPI